MDDVEFTTTKIATPADAVDRGFLGSPTILTDGSDPAGDTGHPRSLACRIYGTRAGCPASPI